MVSKYLLFLLQKIPFIGSLFVNRNEALWYDDQSKSQYYAYLSDPPNYQKALKYLQRAIKLGYPDGNRDLAYFYDFQLEDDKKAFYYYQKCAEEGDAKCQGQVGLHYLDMKNLPKAHRNLHDYMRHTVEVDLDVLYVRPYLVLSILMIAMGRNSTIDFLDKSKKLVRELFDDKDKYQNSFIHRYESFAELSDEAQSAALEFFADHEITDYEHGTYDMVFYWNDEIFEYLLSIFSYGFMLPEESQRPFFDVALSSSDPILFVTFEI